MKHSALLIILGIAVLLAGCQGNKNTVQNADEPDVQAADENQEAVETVNAVETIKTVETGKIGQVGKEIDEQRAAYLSAKTGVGFNMLSPQQLTEDLRRADEMGLVILNAPYEKNGKSPRLFEWGLNWGWRSCPFRTWPAARKSPRDLSKLI